LYSDTVLAIEQDDLATASSYLREMLNYGAPASELRIKDITDPSKDPIAARYAQFINTDESLKIEVFPPSHEASATCRALIRHAFELMERGDPDLAAEIRALLREIVLGAGSLDKSIMTFDGASAFMLWGAIIINSNQRTDELAMVQMLAHESSHNLLFGLSSDEPLVDNPPDETYSSPLRRDPRPMDGIYHATFVTARMYRAVWQLLKSGILSAEQRQTAEKELAVNRRLFESGIETVDKYAVLTPLGREIMAGAKAYMVAGC
jgi:HEXXH motif-containing protein